jgi:hypothetical protein
MIQISFIGLWLAISGATFFGFILCTILTGGKTEEDKYTGERREPAMPRPTARPPKSKSPAESLPCAAALRCPMANDVYCAECDSHTEHAGHTERNK